MSSGVRCAETTCASCGTSNSPRAAAAADITDQSESLPMITPTSGASAMTVSVREVVSGRAGPPTHVGQVVTERGHVPDLAAGAEPLAVQMNLHVRPPGHAVVH